MSFRATDRRIWDTTATLEALALPMWPCGSGSLNPIATDRQCARRARWVSDRWRPNAPPPPSARLALPQDRALAEEVLKLREPGSEIVARMRMRGGETCIWRGVWLEEGVRAAGVVAPETKFAASERCDLTGLLDRKSFIAGLASACNMSGCTSWWWPTSIGCAA
jgi:c-di-GMP-specific phosphodiesterase